MTALAKDRQTVMQAGEIIDLPVLTNAVIYLGSLVNVTAAGYAKAAANTSGELFMGVAEESVDATGVASGVKRVKVRRRGIAHMVAAGLAVGNIGDDLYVTDDQTVQTVAANVRCGKLAYFESATVAPLDMDPLRYGGSPGQDYFTMNFFLPGAVTESERKLADNLELPRAFKVLRGYADCQTAPGSAQTCTITITDGTSPQTFTITGTATHGEDEAIDQEYAANTDIDISAVDGHADAVTADLSVTLVCQFV